MLDQSIIEEVYHDFLDEIDKKKQEEYPGGNYFRASSSGMCHRKHYFKSVGMDETDKDPKSIRLFRLGTLVHEDIQKSLISRLNKPKLNFIKHIYVEEEYILPEYNVMGHVDLAIETIDEFHVYEFKTVNSYKWKMMFGRDRDKNPSVNYEVQLAVNTLGLQKKLWKDSPEKPKPAFMHMLYYKKDDSSVKIVDIPDFYLQRATDYWHDVNQYVKEVKKNPELLTLEPGKQLGVPVSSWECNEKYCVFHNICFNNGGSDVQESND